MHICPAVFQVHGSVSCVLWCVSWIHIVSPGPLKEKHFVPHQDPSRSHLDRDNLAGCITHLKLVRQGCGRSLAREDPWCDPRKWMSRNLDVRWRRARTIKAAREQAGSDSGLDSKQRDHPAQMKSMWFNITRPFKDDGILGLLTSCASCTLPLWGGKNINS